MSLADELNSTATVSPKNQCQTCWAFKSSSIEDKKALDDYMSAMKPISELRKILESNGITVSENSLQSHRKNRHVLA